jgi:hypothetical protein
VVRFCFPEAFAHIFPFLKIPHVIRDIITSEFVLNNTRSTCVHLQTHEVVSWLIV